MTDRFAKIISYWVVLYHIKTNLALFNVARQLFGEL